MDLSGAAVLVAGARVTGRAILAALTPLGVRATLTDDSPSALTTYAQSGVAVIDAANAADEDHRLRPRRHQPRLAAHRAGAGRCGRGRRADLG